MTECPGCGGKLEGLATFCHGCLKYVADFYTGEGSESESARATPLIPDDRLEDVIQLATKRALAPLGFVIYDLSQGRPTRQTEGIADLYVCGFGRCTWVEMKKADGIQSPNQIAFEGIVTENGAEYHVWRHETEAIEWAKAAIEAAA